MYYINNIFSEAEMKRMKEQNERFKQEMKQRAEEARKKKIEEKAKEKERQKLMEVVVGSSLRRRLFLTLRMILSCAPKSRL